jgi:membrane protein
MTDPRPDSPVTWTPRFAALKTLGVLGKALARLWGRDVMLYVGGVSFFALLAVFPAVALIIGFFKVVLNTGVGLEQAEALIEVVPHAARGLLQSEIERLIDVPFRSISAQSAVALVVGAYAAHRGFKAVLAGLTFIHDETDQHGFFRFNLLAFIVAICAFLLLTVVSGAILTIRLMHETQETEPLEGLGLDSEWMWAFTGLTIGLTLLYRYAMAHSKRVPWRAAIGGGIGAALLLALASWACAVYVDQVVELGATYGSIGAVVVFLIWLSWNVNAVFFGGALATEIEIALHQYRRANAAAEAATEADLSLSEPRHFW